MRKLAKTEIMSVLIEGGSKVAASALKSKIVDKVVFFYTPKIVGSEGISMIGELGIPTIKESIEVKKTKTEFSEKEEEQIKEKLKSLGYI